MRPNFSFLKKKSTKPWELAAAVITADCGDMQDIRGSSRCKLKAQNTGGCQSKDRTTEIHYFVTTMPMSPDQINTNPSYDNGSC
jgi:hypothetical protein